MSRSMGGKTQTTVQNLPTYWEPALCLRRNRSVTTDTMFSRVVPRPRLPRSCFEVVRNSLSRSPSDRFMTRFGVRARSARILIISLKYYEIIPRQLSENAGITPQMFCITHFNDKKDGKWFGVDIRYLQHVSSAKRENFNHLPRITVSLTRITTHSNITNIVCITSPISSKITKY